jgi:hypothetical protein
MMHEGRAYRLDGLNMIVTCSFNSSENVHVLMEFVLLELQASCYN